MSVQSNLNGQIQQYTQQKAACEGELNRLNTDLAISENTLKTIMASAQETFGTVDLNQLGTILSNLNTEYDALNNELNGINNQ